jgi:carbon-monoxide dehydrogenase medium subunit
LNTLKLPPFDYHEPSSVGAVTQLLALHGSAAQVVAGGIDLVPSIRAGSVRPSSLISLQGLKELDFVRAAPDGSLEIGALASLHALERSELLKSRYPALQEAIRQITSVQTKCMGTAVGNLCVGTPASDLGPVFAVLDGEMVVAGPHGERRIPICDFYVGYRRIALQAGEFATSVRIPPGPPGRAAAFINLTRTHADIAKITVAAAVSIQDGVCRGVRIALGSVAPTMIRARAAEAILEGKPLGKQLLASVESASMQDATPIDDIRLTAEYRRQVTRVLVRRALLKAAGQSARSAGETLPTLQ